MWEKTARKKNKKIKNLKNEKQLFYGIVEEITHYQHAYIYFQHIKYFVQEEMFIKTSQFSHLTDEICALCQSLSYRPLPYSVTVILILFIFVSTQYISINLYMYMHILYIQPIFIMQMIAVLSLLQKGIYSIFQRNARQGDLFLKLTILE